jgi:tryptophanyl-tRNA synthetase
MSSSFNENYSDDFEVTPWKVEGSVDYARLIEKFGTQEITNELLEKIE